MFLKNFAYFTGKHLRWSLFFNKVASLRPLALLKKRTFSVNFAKFLRTPFLKITSGGCVSQSCYNFAALGLICCIGVWNQQICEKNIIPELCSKRKIGRPSCFILTVANTFWKTENSNLRNGFSTIHFSTLHNKTWNMIKSCYWQIIVFFLDDGKSDIVVANDVGTVSRYKGTKKLRHFFNLWLSSLQGVSEDKCEKCIINNWTKILW